MDEDIINPSLPDNGLTEKKKRGRKPRVQQTSDDTHIKSTDAEKPAKKRGRPKKVKTEDAATIETAATTISPKVPEQTPTQNGPLWRDLPTPEQSEESYKPDNEIFTGSDNRDDFEYSKSQSQDNRQDSEEIPQSFSTSDEDLDPDSYRNRYDDDNRDVADSPSENAAQTSSENREHKASSELSDPNYESFAEAEAARQERRNTQNNNNGNRRNWKNRQDNNRQDNRNGNQPNRQFDNRQQNQRFQQNRQFDNRQQNRQNRQFDNRQQNQQQNRQFDNRNGNQPNRQFENRQQNQQNRQQNPNQQNRLKKPFWKQNSADSEAMNPADLPEWNVLKSQEGIANWLADLFADKVSDSQTQVAPTATEVATESETENIADSQSKEIAGEKSSDEIDTLAARQISTENDSTAADAELKSDDTPALPSVAPEDMSYWELLTNSNDSRIEHGEPIVEEKPAQPELPAITSADAEKSAPATPDNSLSPDAVSAPEEKSPDAFVEQTSLYLPDGSIVDSVSGYEELCPLHIKELRTKFAELSIPLKGGLSKSEILAEFFRAALEKKKLVRVKGPLDVFEDGLGGAITFSTDSYVLKSSSVYVPQFFIETYGLKRGHIIGALATAPRSGNKENCPIAVKITSVMDSSPDEARAIIPFTDLTPYYPTRRIILESAAHNAKDNLSMRAVDLLTPLGLGQRALIVAPPRTGKTVLMQNMAKSIRINNPDAKLIILLVDERPEEVTDFKRAIDAEVIASTFDQDAASHVHAAEMVISKARRMVEVGQDVVILLDSITRLARAYNALMPNGGRTMSGGVEANALQKPKKFFGSARNIEGGGSLTIVGTALIETGSKMDEVIFEEFKGTGNLELNLDRALSDKRIFPAINIEKSGTRKEELLYHPDELTKIYALRRAMKGVPASDAMEMLIQRLKKVKTNVEFLLGLNR